MSFAQQVKNEISKKDFGKYKKQMSCGLVCFSRNFSPKLVGMGTENESAAFVYKNTIESISKIRMNLSFGGEKKSLYTVISGSVADSETVYGIYSELFSKILVEIERKKNKSDLIAPFLTGAFLACGNISDPNKFYYLDFTLPTKHHSEIISLLLDTIGIKHKIMIRNTDYVVYIKESGYIEDILTYIGAIKAVLRFIDIKIYKEIRNLENRKNNFEIANIEKTATAAALQIFDIEYIVETKGWEFFPDDLKNVAMVRIENPDLPLGSLAELINPPLSRSSTNRRLNKIRNLAEKLRSLQKDVKNID